MDKRFKLYEQGLSDEEIAKRCKLKANSIKKWRQLNGLKSNNKIRNKRYDIDVVKTVVCLHYGGSTATEISEALNIPVSSVYGMFKKYKLKARKYGRKCEFCNRIYVAVVKYQHKCKECNKNKDDIFYEMRHLKSIFFKLAKTNPEMALGFKKEIVNETNSPIIKNMLENILKSCFLIDKDVEKIIKDSGFVFECNLKLKHKKLFKNEIIYGNIKFFIYKNRHYGNFNVYYIDPFILLDGINEDIVHSNVSHGFKEDIDIIDIKQKIFKQHKDYIISEINNKDGIWYMWNERNSINKRVYEMINGD